MLKEIAFAFFLCVSCNIAAEIQCGTIWLTVSSLSGPESQDKLEINWNFTCPPNTEPPNVVKLFNGDPVNTRTLKPILSLSIKNRLIGNYRTNITAITSPLPGGWAGAKGAALPGPHCFDHHAVLYRNNVFIMTTCLKIQPTWMQDLRQQLSRMPIASLMIPGTHNSGSFKNNYVFESIVDPFTLNQDCDIWTQLVHGIRYLDMRVAYYENDGFWVNHWVFSVTLLSDVIRDVRNFLDLAQGEVVILDFHRFPEGFEDEDIHARLVRKLFQSFRDLIVAFRPGSEGLGPSLGNMVNSGRRLIICYHDMDTVRKFPWLWPPMNQAWDNQKTPQGLVGYINKVMARDHRLPQTINPLWAVMAELTPDPFDIIFGPSTKIRDLADAINRNLSTLFLDQWSKQTNIVATDFFRGNNLIDVAIQSNIRKCNAQRRGLRASITTKPVTSTKCGQVWLTVSSLLNSNVIIGKFRDTNLEINWSLNCPSGVEPPKVIKVFTTDPMKDPPPDPELSLNLADYPDGYVRTNITVGNSTLPGGWDSKGGNALPGPHCLPYYAALGYEYGVLTISCLQIQPTWMGDFQGELGDLQIGSLMIPGTHDSGSYNHSRDHDVSMFENYIRTQDRDIWTQLVHGIRYIDLKVEYYSWMPVIKGHSIDIIWPGAFAVTHDTSLLTVIEDVQRFFNVTSTEIVILDFRQMILGFGRPSVHHGLIALLRRSFGPLVFEYDRGTNGLGPTLNHMWNTGKRLIICYNNEQMVKEHEWLWPSIPQATQNDYTPEGLLQYVDKVMVGDKKPKANTNPLWAVMAFLTPRLGDPSFKPFDGLRTMADLVNRNLSMMFQGKWCLHPNIVATDYFLGNSLVDVSIHCNKLRGVITALRYNSDVIHL